MHVIIVGTGKLATELLQSLPSDSAVQVRSWANKGTSPAPSIVVHAGSGRELAEVTRYCQATHSTLVELATGSELETHTYDFPVVLCPNTNVLMLKFMSMLAQCGQLFSNHRITLTESHQAQKTSLPGTAASIAQALGLHGGSVVSVRDPTIQEAELHIPAQHLARHAYHQIVIEDGACSVTLETRVYGDSPYADGVARIVAAIGGHMLDNRRYDINEFVENGWI